jgi:hypothetical protein
MTDFFKHDDRITDPALRDLEKKVHWLIYQMAQQGLVFDLNAGQISFPDDCNSMDIQNDALQVSLETQAAGITSGSGALSNQ